MMKIHKTLQKAFFYYFLTCTADAIREYFFVLFWGAKNNQKK